MTGIPVFFCAESGFVDHVLRRFTFGRDGGCQHDATNPDPVRRVDVGPGRLLDVPAMVDHADPRWPTHCAKCGYAFEDSDEWQVSQRRVYVRSDTGEEISASPYALPVGAVIDAHWHGRKGADGRALQVMTPGGPWLIDSRASNCTLPQDDEHRCWVRHGRPEDGTLHVDKDGPTCAAGAGSIQVGAYHGFLHHGALTPA